MKSPAVLATTFEFFCLLLGDMVFQAVLYLLYLAPMSEAAKSNWATAFAYGLSLITLIMLLTWVVPRDEVKTALKRSTKFWREVWLVAIVFPLTVVVSGFVADRLSGPLQLTNNQQDVVHLIGASPLLPMLLLVAVIGPIMEETYFRGVLLNRFKQSGQLWLGVLFSAFWFAIGHGFIMDDGFWWALPFGLILTLLFLWRKTIWPGVLVHMVSNAAVLLIHR